MTWKPCEDLEPLRPAPPVNAWFYDPFTTLVGTVWKRHGRLGGNSYILDGRLTIRKDGGMQTGGLWRVDPRGGISPFRFSVRMNIQNPGMIFTISFFGSEAIMAITWRTPNLIYIEGTGPCGAISIPDYFATDIIWTAVCFGTEISLFMDGQLLCGVHTCPRSYVYGNMVLTIATASKPGRVRISDFAIEDLGRNTYAEWKERGVLSPQPP
ncbi:hypothetical protein LCGC14_1266260 [marine sediment metagenome]|uniref:GH16 domain-containing protein n=1 Tax=marine sediment metagenome TaxID=412755 RepID=A0A0F9NG24_9ZZZZ